METGENVYLTAKFCGLGSQECRCPEPGCQEDAPGEHDDGRRGSISGSDDSLDIENMGYMNSAQFALLHTDDLVSPFSI